MRRSAAVLTVGAFALAPSSAAASGDERVGLIADTLAADEVYVEQAAAAGEAQIWAQRLTAAKSAARLDLPIHVAAWGELFAFEPSIYTELPAEWTEQVGSGVYVLAEDTSYEVVPHPDEEMPRRLLSAQLTTLAVQAEAIRLHRRELAGGDLDAAPPPTSVRLIGIAQAWIFLRVLAQDPVGPRALAAEVAAIDGALVRADYGARLPYDRGVSPLEGPRPPILIGLVVFGYLGYRAARYLRTRPAKVDHAPGSTSRLVEITPAEVEQEITALATAISLADARPGELSYDRAQTCRDAAERYADADADRDRVGVLLLCRDGAAWLGGHTPRSRCYFNPDHDATTRVRDRSFADHDVPACRACVSAVRSGRAPDRLVFEEASEARPRPYYEDDDVWSRTGFGSLSHDWAEQVLRASWERR